MSRRRSDVDELGHRVRAKATQEPGLPLPHALVWTIALEPDLVCQVWSGQIRFATKVKATWEPGLPLPHVWAEP